MKVKSEIIQQKIYKISDLQREISRLKFLNKRIAFTNGCFDIIHRGHVEYLAKAAELADVLILGLNTDNSVKRLKGPSRPINDENARALIIASLQVVDYVVLFDEETPYNLIDAVKPDILVKGGDYVIEDIVGYDIVTSNGGKVLTIPFVDGFSSTSIIEKM